MKMNITIRKEEMKDVEQKKVLNLNEEILKLVKPTNEYKDQVMRYREFFIEKMSPWMDVLF